MAPTNKKITKQNSFLMNLTWEDLNDWAGERIVRRGKSYQGNVEDLRITSDGALVASVHGTEFYSTRAGINDDGDLFSECTCPYGGTCKHAVAVILVYLGACKTKKQIPVAEEDDERLLELSGEDDENDDYSIDAAAWRNHPEKKSNKVRSHLESLSKNELVDLVMNGENIIPELGRKLTDRDNLKKGDIGKLVASIRKEIKMISSESAWSDHWHGEHNIPDYSPVKKRLEALLSSNHVDIVVDLGAYLMERGIQQIEHSNDEGETCMEIGSCMEVVFKAVMRSSLSVVERLLWDIDLHLRDDYGILDDLKGPVAIGKASSSDWSKVADVLSKRLDELPKRPTGKDNDFSSKYRREKVMDWLIHALEMANRKDKINEILERETAQTDCYVELVKRLVQEKKIEKAREWAYKGFATTLANAPGIASQLENLLRDMALGEKNYLLAAAHCAFEFFDRPSVEEYSQLESVATRAGVWAEVKGHVMSFLEKGERPTAAWPLPILQLPVRDRTTIWTRFPDIDTLIDIAIKEKHHDDVLKWYRLGIRSNGVGRASIGEKVAQAIQVTHPDEALCVWKATVDQEISQAKPAAYQTAGSYLKKMKAIYTRINRPHDWTQYMAELREHNKRRPRMLDVLNSLEGQRTRIVQ